MINKIKELFGRSAKIIVYGLSLGLSIAVLKIIEYKFFIRDNAMELYLGGLALLFTVLGIWMGLKLTKPKTETIEKIIDGREFEIDRAELARLNISAREYEVLKLLAEGFSNNEIAEKLFVSLNTIKTHTSSLFSKLDASRRTQAVSKAKSLSLIP